MTTATPSKASSQFLTTQDVLQALNISCATLYRLMSKGAFPRPVKLGIAKNSWLRADVDNFVARHVAARGVLQ